MPNANIITVAGRPHDIRCPQTGRTDVSDCCKPMVAFTAMMEERERCAKVIENGSFVHDQSPAALFAKEAAAAIRRGP